MTTSSDSSVKTTSFWIGKPSTHKLWQHVDDFVTDYTSEHQSDLQSEWLRKWHFLMNDIRIGDKNRDFQVIALSLTSNPDATIKECINAALDMIPSLREHFAILEMNTDKGTFKCKIDKYKFTTPKEKQKARSPPRPVTKKASNANNTNRYASLQDDEELDIDIRNPEQTVTFATEKPPPEVNEVILEQYSASTLSEHSKLTPVNIQEEFKNEDPKQADNQPKISDYTSPFSRFKNNTTNALRKAAYKAQDFAQDRDIPNILKNNPIINSVRSTPPFSNAKQNQNAEVIDIDNMDDLNDVMNIDIKRDLNIMQNERKAMNMRFKELKEIVDTFEWENVENGAKQLHNKYMECVTNLNNHASRLTTTINTTLNREQTRVFSTFKQECSLEMHKMRVDFNNELNNQKQKYQAELLKEKKNHMKEMTTLKTTLTNDIKALVTQLEANLHNTYANAVKTPIPPTTSSTTVPAPQVPQSSSNPPSIPNFGPTPTPPTTGTGTSTNPIQFITDQRLIFEHHGIRYTLNDKDFLKSTAELLAPTMEEDALTFYATLQKQALTYNIFITPIDKVQRWDQSPGSIPTTCDLQYSPNTTYFQAYQRMATALFTKISKVNYNRIKVFQTLINHEKASQDGFCVLYSFLSFCHPKILLIMLISIFQKCNVIPICLTSQEGIKIGYNSKPFLAGNIQI